MLNTPAWALHICSLSVHKPEMDDKSAPNNKSTVWVNYTQSNSE